METYQIFILVILFAFVQAVYYVRKGYAKGDVEDKDIIALCAIVFIVFPLVTFVLVFDALDRFIKWVVIRGSK